LRDNVCDFREGQRRLNSLATNLLRRLFREYVVAVHRRERRGRLHYHLVAVTKEDVRTGFDFEAWRRLASWCSGIGGC
jgi:hypothetical protein